MLNKLLRYDVLIYKTVKYHRKYMSYIYIHIGTCFISERDQVTQSCLTGLRIYATIRPITVLSYARCRNTSVMALCGFKNILFESSLCGKSSEYDDHECVALKDCNRDVTWHLQVLKISSDTGVNSEAKLLLARAGKL